MITLNDQYEVPILRALDEHGGRTTGQVAALFASPFGRSKREHSSDVRAWLLKLKGLGLVVEGDDGKPTIWIRTAKGSAALSKVKG